MNNCPCDSIEIIPTADFVLRTCNGTSNNAYNGSYTWNDVDIRSILGDLYYKYDYFQLCLKAIVASPSLEPPNNHDVRRVFMMNGLQWQGCNYNTNSTTRPPSLTNKTCIGLGTFTLMTTTIGGAFQPCRHIANTFRKGKENVSLTIEYYSPTTQVLTAPQTMASGYQGMVFMFKIIPIKKIEQSSATLTLMSLFATGSTTPSLTWKNYNLKLALGTLWDKFDVFNIELIQYQQDTIGTSTASGNNLTGQLLLSGLPFIPGSTSQVLGLYDFSSPQSLTPININTNDLNIVTFSKNQLLSDINIKFWNYIDDRLLVMDSGTYPAGVFVFKVTGVVTDAIGDVTK